MKRIFFSLIVIALTAAASIGLTTAYFSDTETSVGNTFAVGTIDISINDQNPWEESFVLNDLKPGYTDSITFNIQNLDSNANPVNIYKLIRIDPDTGFSTGVQTQPECQEEQGTWDEQSKTCLNPAAENNDLSEMINYDMSVWVYNSDEELLWWQTIYDHEVTIKDVYYDPDEQTYSVPVYLGMIPNGGYMEVKQSYQLSTEVSNWAQGDIMTFDIEIKGEQLNGILPMDNKITERDGQEYWKLTPEDEFNGLLTYNPRNPTFEFEFVGTAPSPTADYTLVVGEEPWNNGITLGQAISDGDGNIAIAGNLELNSHLQNYRTWLVLTADWAETGMPGWNPDQYLFETGLVWFEDTNI